MKRWGFVCCLVSLVVLFGCATQADRDHKTVVASGYGVDQEAAHTAARQNAMEELEAQGLEGYEVVSESAIEIQKTDFSTQREDGTVVSVEGYTAKTQFSFLGPEPQPEPEEPEVGQEEPEQEMAQKPKPVRDFVLP